MTKTTILNTRPIEFQNDTNNVFIQHGYAVINCPCIEIKIINDCRIISQLKQIKDKSVIIFTSQYAVTSAFTLYPDWKIPNHSIVIAVGKKSAECIEHNSNTTVLVPEKQNSEGVIELLKGLKNTQFIYLLTAANGRQAIQDYAIKQQFNLTQINLYQRSLPQASDQTLEQISHTKTLYVLATSISTLNNLKLIVNKNLWNKILTQPLLCASSRIELYAKQLGFINTFNVNTANSEHIALQLNKILKK